jgi:hypothetical protein
VTVDEMDLVSQLKDAAPLRPGAYEQARTMLRVAMAESGSGPDLARVPEITPLRAGAVPGRRNRRGTLGKAGLGAGIGAAAAAAIALVVTSSPPPRGAGRDGLPGARGAVQADLPGRPGQGQRRRPAG